MYVFAVFSYFSIFLSFPNPFYILKPPESVRQLRQSDFPASGRGIWKASSGVPWKGQTSYVTLVIVALGSQSHCESVGPGVTPYCGLGVGQQTLCPKLSFSILFFISLAIFCGRKTNTKPPNPSCEIVMMDEWLKG